MSISSKATGLRPGVCTSTTRPTSPYTGMVIFETDTGYLRVWDGSAWDYLSQSQGDTIGLGATQGLVLVTQTTYTSSSAVNVDSCFTTSFDHYLLVASSQGSAGTNQRIKFRSGGTTDSSNLYYTQGLYPNNNATGYIYDFPVTTGHFAGNVTSTTGELGTFTAQVWNPKASARTSMFIQWEATSSGLGGFNNCVYAANTSFDGFSLFPASGTITGSVQVYGYRK